MIAWRPAICLIRCICSTFSTGHVEGPERLDAINRALDETGMRDRLVALTPQPISIERLSRVHQARHIERVRSVAERGGGGLMGHGR